LGDKGVSESARMLRTNPVAGLRLKGWSKLAMCFSSSPAVRTKFIAHSVAFALESG